PGIDGAVVRKCAARAERAVVLAVLRLQIDDVVDERLGRRRGQQRQAAQYVLGLQLVVRNREGAPDRTAARRRGAEVEHRGAGGQSRRVAGDRVERPGCVLQRRSGHLYLRNLPQQAGAALYDQDEVVVGEALRAVDLVVVVRPGGGLGELGRQHPLVGGAVEDGDAVRAARVVGDQHRRKHARRQRAGGAPRGREGGGAVVVVLHRAAVDAGAGTAERERVVDAVSGHAAFALTRVQRDRA